MSSARVMCRCCHRPAVWSEGRRRWLLAADAIASPWLRQWHTDHPVDPVRDRTT